MGEHAGRERAPGSFRREAGQASAGAAPAVPTEAERQEEFRRSVAVSAPNRTGLPDRLKSGLERLSGFDLGDVRVHYGSSAPRALGADAYAKGHEIHLAPGQEKHLPHEGWHVVQQKQGRVRPTGRAGGLPVNDDPILEREADVRGAAAMAAGAGAASAIYPAAEPGLTGQGIAQRVLAQVVSNDEDTVVDDIVIIGRPEKNLFTGSMGAHSTPWAVHVDAVRRAVAGKSYALAWEGLKGLYLQAVQLPGMQLQPDEFTARRALEAQAAVHGTLSRDIAAVPQKIELLQQAVREYLDFRDLIPLSAVNVRLIGGSVGGLGEAGPLQFLRQSEGAFPNGPLAEPVQIAGAVMKLLDADALLRVAVELSPLRLEGLSPGMPAAKTFEDRLKLFIGQHLKAVEAAYPQSLARSTLTPDTAYQAFMQMHGGAIVRRLQLDLSWVESRRAALHGQWLRLQEDLALAAALKRAPRKPKAGAVVAVRAAGAPVKPTLQVEIEELDQQKTHLSGLLTTLGAAPQAPPQQVGPTQPAAAQPPSVQPQASDPAAPAAEEEVETGGDPRQTLAVNLTLTGTQVAALITAGRPESPHPGGRMGAHTTAWAVRIDAIAGRLRNQPLASTPDILAQLVAEAKAANQRLIGHFPLEEQHRARLANAETRLNATVVAMTARPSLSLVQKAIRDLLSFMNLSPGASRDSVDTTGKGESASRAALQNHQFAGPSGIKDAIAGLLDVAPTSSKYVPLALEHLRYVMDAYPGGYRTAGFPDPRTLVDGNGGLTQAGVKVLEEMARRWRDPDAEFEKPTAPARSRPQKGRGKAGMKKTPGGVQGITKSAGRKSAAGRRRGGR